MIGELSRNPVFYMGNKQQGMVQAVLGPRQTLPQSATCSAGVPPLTFVSLH